MAMSHEISCKTDLFRLHRPRVDEETDDHLRYLHEGDHHCDWAGHAPSVNEGKLQHEWMSTRTGATRLRFLNTLVLIRSHTSRPCRHNTNTWRSGRCNSLRWTTASWQYTPTNRRRNTWARSCGGTYGNSNTSLQFVRRVVVQNERINLVQKGPHVWNDMHIASFTSFIYLYYVTKCLVQWVVICFLRVSLGS